jgi:hypothetical protein
MHQLRNLLLLALALSLLIFVGCSQQETALPTTPQQSTCQDYVTLDGLGTPAERLPDLLGSFGPFLAEPGSIGSYKDILRSEDTQIVPTATLPVPLPKSKLVKEVAAIALAAVDGGTYWPVKTWFRNEGDELWGFQVAALEDNPLAGCYDGSGYYCYYYTDFKVYEPVDPVLVDAYSSPISDSLSRVLKALREPETLINKYYYTDNYFYYVYAFDYPDGDGYRRFGICKFNLCILDDPVEDPFQ